MLLKKCVAAFACLAMTAPMNVFAADPSNQLPPTGIKHVLLISVDGLHALDLTNWVASNPDSNIGQLARHGTRYTNATSSTPSDSFPGLAALVTGGSPTTTGLWYDVTYNRVLAPPAWTTPYGIVGSPSACANGVQGTPVGFDEEIDLYLTDLNGGGGINPNYLPRDPNHGCAPVYPHNYLRVNTIFEVVKAAGGYTAWIDKHPSYEWTNGPSGHGVDDFWGPEINSNVSPLNLNTGQYSCDPVPDPANAVHGTPFAPGNAWTDSAENIQCYDTWKVRGVLNQIDGYNYARSTTAPVPTLFGMNFQAVSVGQKLKTGGYTDVLGTPSPVLDSELHFVDAQLGKIVHELQAQGVYDSTLIILAAKHGQSPIDKSKLTDVDSSLPSSILASAGYAYDISDDGSLIWLKDPSFTPQAVELLSDPATQSKLGIQEIFALQSLSQKWNVAGKDPRTPDIILKTNTGVIFTGGSKIAEHGGLNEDDFHVGLLVSFPTFHEETVKTPVSNQQVAASIVKALGIDPENLQAVKKEGITPLPFLFK